MLKLSADAPRGSHGVVFSLLIVIVAAAAFAFRLPHLDERPMHTDEAVHAVKLGALLDTGDYVYNPHEYHGPTLYYFSLPFVWLSGARIFLEIPDEVPLRIVPVVFGVGLIVLLLLMGDGVGRRAALFAGVLTAVSPAMVFYSRYYVQEMLLVFFTFAAIVAGWRYTRTKRLGWALVAGASLGLMHATKETCVIAYAAMLGGLVLTLCWTRLIDRKSKDSDDAAGLSEDDREEGSRLLWHLAAAIAVAAAVSFVCLSAFLSHPQAAMDSVRAYAHYFHRAVTGAGSNNEPGVHYHAWYYYLRMLAFTKYSPGPWWSEGTIMLLAIAGIGKALKRSREPVQGHTSFNEADTRLLRFLAFYTILMTAAYAIIPYKTPWCLLGFLHGLILMAGVGAVALYERADMLKRGEGRAKIGLSIILKVIVCFLLVLSTYHLGLQAYRGSFVFLADTRNPYVYAHTSPDLRRLVERVEQIALLHPDRRDMVVKIIVPGSDYWPLPWHFRRFTHVGYWDAAPNEPDAPIIISTPELEKELDAKLRDAYQKEYFGLRPEVLLLTYTRMDLWNEFIEGRT